jgi:hypothetical protein
VSYRLAIGPPQRAACGCRKLGCTVNRLVA